jgi:diguanylate cyclase (GGDEF)-like protein/PAS domain S-box-containing protein
LHLTHPDERTDVVASWMECLSLPNCEQRGLFRYRHRDGHYVWFETMHVNRLADPAVGRIISQMIDVSDRMEAIEMQRAQAQLLRRLTEALPIGIVQIDAQRRIVHRNERLGALLGIENAATIDEQFARLRECDREAVRAALSALAERDAPGDIEVMLDRSSGERFSVSIRSLTAEDGTVSGAIACVADITERARMRDELEQRAAFDELTQCRNRATILEKLATLLAAASADFAGLAVLFIDLNGFKQINDTYGHAAGDDLLRCVAQRLLHGVRPADVVGRLGGDEFLVVCPNIDSPELALNIARRLDASVAQPTTIGAQSIVPQASIGVAWSGRPIEAELFVAQADAAMYAAKRENMGPVLSEAVHDAFVR